MKRFTKRFLKLAALLSVEAIIIGAVFLACLLLFGFVTREVFVEHNNALDAAAMFHFAGQQVSPAMTRLMRGISFFASAEYLLVVPALVVLVFSFFRHLHWYGLQILLISFTSSMLNQLLKHLFERPRPATAMLFQSGLSFPSGHAMIGGCFYGLLVYIIWKTVKGAFWRWFFTAFFTILELLIGYSRIYLQVHYATDVLAGYAAGIFWLVLSIYLLRRFEHAYISGIQEEEGL
jgi:undecaprenyl-diphosphatase